MMKLTEEYLSSLSHVEDVEVNHCKQWLDIAWDIQQYGILFLFLHWQKGKYWGASTLTPDDLWVLAISCHCDSYYDPDDWGYWERWENLKDDFSYKDNQDSTFDLFREKIKSLGLSKVNMRPIYSKQWMYPQGVSLLNELLREIKGLPKHHGPICAMSVKECYRSFNRGLVTMNYYQFLKQILGDNHHVKVERNLIDRDAPIEYLENIITWSILKDQPMISLSPQETIKWFNGAVLGQYLSPQKCVKEWCGKYVGEDSFKVAFYHWCVGRGYTPATSSDGRYLSIQG